MKGNLRFLIVEQNSIAGAENLRSGLELLKKDYNDATQGEVTISWTFDQFAFAGFSINFAYFEALYKFFEEKYKDKIDFLVFVISPETWKYDFFGIHNGIYKAEAKNPYSIVAFKNSPTYNVFTPKATLAEEHLHSFNDWPNYKEPKMDVNQLFEVNNYDEETVHGHRYQYNFIYAKMKPYLIQWFPYSGGGENMAIVDRDKLFSIFHELLFRDPDPGAEGYIGKDETFVRKEVGASLERQKLVNFINSAKQL